MTKKQEHNCLQLLKLVEDAKNVNPLILRRILYFIHENDGIKIDLKFVAPNEVDMTLSNDRECKVRCVNRTAWIEYQF